MIIIAGFTLTDADKRDSAVHECAFIPLEVAQRRRYRRAHLVIRLGQLSVNANT